jgi:hypothetical protein
VRQIAQGPIDYLTSLWNYIDLIPPFGIYIYTVVMILNSQITTENTDMKYISARTEGMITSLISFFMWIKFLYFLRIFENTGYLIRMITEVIVDMRHFFLVLLVTIAAFGDAFLKISMSNMNEDKQFTTNFVDSLIFTYRMILGDFDTTEFGEEATGLCVALWLLCTIFNMIVMLNLLIAIISESFAKINNIA